MTELRSPRARPRRRVLLIGALTVAALAAGCSSGGTTNSSSSPAGTSGTAAPPRSRTNRTLPAPGGTAGGTTNDTTGGDPTSGPAPTNGATSLDAKVKLNAVGKVDSPVAMTARPGSATLYVAEQKGRVRALHVNADGTSGTVDTGSVLDLSADVAGNGERGLLGLAFSPDGGTLFAYYTDQTGRIHLVSYEMQGDAVDQSSRVELLSLQHDRANHNGGQLQTGPDGFLYIGVGDGGGGGDPDRNGQNPKTLYGKILRIDPSKPAGGKAYGIPPGNPFADGKDGAPEVWIYGARNPWRFSFDKETGDLWIGDVGQDEIEEIDFLPNTAEGAGRGANLGWPNLEGSRPYKGGSPPAGAVPPVFEYNHDDKGCSVISGYVYRGRKIPALTSVLPYGDYCIGAIRGLLTDAGDVLDDASLGADVDQLTTFGQDNDGEQYAAGQTGTIYRLAAG